MREWILLGSVAAVYLPVIASPGPNFLVVTNSAVRESRRHGICTALGVATGSTVLAGLAATCMGWLLAHFGAFQPGIRTVGGAYLLYVGVKIWRQAGSPLPGAGTRASSSDMLQAYRNGLATNLTNPKALLFFSSVFAALLTPGTAPWLKAAGVVLICSISVAWHIALATLFSSMRVQRIYGRAKGWINRVTAGLLAAVGLRLLIG